MKQISSNKKIRPPMIPNFLLKFILRKEEYLEKSGDLEEIYHELAEDEGKLKAYFWYWYQVLLAIPTFINNTFYWGTVMFKSYLIIAFRNMNKHIGYSILNIFGLAIGIASFLLLFLFVQFEFNYDTQHPYSERIYRVAKSHKSKAKTDLLAANVTFVAPALVEKFPEVEIGIRMGRGNNRYTMVENQKYLNDRLVYTDKEIFELFDIKFLLGDKETSLQEYNNIVITEHISKKYFGDNYPIGKIIMVDTVAHKVSAVIEDCPKNTHFKYDMLKKLKYDESSEWYQYWGGWHCMNYIRLREGINVKEFEEKIKFLPHEYIGEKLEKDGIEFTLFLQPIEDIHLYSNLIWEEEAVGNPLYIYILGIAGIFIFLIAVINYVNLSTARMANRAMEVGLRKVIGANRKQLINQFIGESVLFSFFAIVASIIFALIGLLLFSELTGIWFTPSDLMRSDNLLTMGGIFLFIGILAGSYPAFVLSTYNPITVLNGNIRGCFRSSWLRKVLVVGQFSMSIILIISTILFYKQIDFMKNKSLGFSKEQKIVIEFNRSIIDTSNYQQVRAEFLNYSGVKSASFSSSVPGRWMYKWRMYPTGEKEINTQMVNAFQVDENFFNDYDLEMIAGVPFKKGVANDGWIINETALSTFGWNTPEQALLNGLYNNNSPIRGVVKNFHYRGLQAAVEPVAIFYMVEDYRYLTLKVETKDIENIITFIEKKHDELFPGMLYDFFFLDEDFNKQYAEEEKFSQIISLFTILGISIACIGLFGLAAYYTEQKTKEIGIRKVLGASITNVAFMLSAEFAKLVLLSNIIAWPIAYFIMDRWMQNFAFRVPIEIKIFLFSAALAFVIAAITVGFQSYKAARTNPVETLKYE